MTDMTPMTDMTTDAVVKQITLEAVVTRADGSVEDLGTVAYWHRSRWRRLRARLQGKGRVQVARTTKN